MSNFIKLTTTKNNKILVNMANSTYVYPDPGELYKGEFGGESSAVLPRARIFFPMGSDSNEDYCTVLETIDEIIAKIAE